jgi:hypothetical protein
VTAFAFDGSSFVTTTVGFNTFSNPFTLPIRFYSYSAAAPAQAQQIAAISPLYLYTSNGIAADSAYLYLAGNGAQGLGIGPQKEGIYRFDRSNLAGPPVQIASFVQITAGGTNHVTLVLDDVANPKFLYARNTFGDIHVIADPAGSAEYVGVINTLGKAGDRAMAYDKLDQAIYFVESETVSTGKIWKLQ